MDRDLSSPAHQLPVTLVVLAIEQHAIVRFQIGVLWERSRPHVFRSGDDVKTGFAQALTDADRGVDIFRYQIKETVRDESVNSDDLSRKRM